MPDKPGPAHLTSAWERNVIFKVFLEQKKAGEWTEKAENR